MATVLGSPLTWDLSRDEEGHRTYNVSHLVKQDLATDGPAAILLATGLPQIGDSWAFGTDFDNWAFCWPNAKVTIHEVSEDGTPDIYRVDQIFTTKPLKRCQDEKIEDPLLEPDRVSGSFVSYTEESTKDRNGEIKKSSSHEIFTGPQVEWDASRPNVIIEQNRADLELSLIASLMHKVNDDMLWGLAKRKIKLSTFSWERKWFGVCGIYYTRRLEFDINDKTFDRDIPDQGTKVLKWVKSDHRTGVYTPDPAADKEDPLDFWKWKDFNGENTKTLLDGNGEPLTKGTGTGPPDPVTVKFEKYEEDNLLQLGIPVDLETA